MTAEVRGYLPPSPRGVVLVLHGGGEHGEEPVSWRGLPVLRLLPFAWAARIAGGKEIGVLRLKNEVFGWNGDLRSPIAGTRWALDRLRSEHPGVPIFMVGHSMGGRVVLDLLDEPDVTGVAALAPWVVAADGVHGHAGQRVLLMHGQRDRITDPRLTEQLAGKLSARGVEVTWKAVAGEGHAMLRHARYWHRSVARFAVRTLREAAD